jgi:hypothetical protein
MYESKDIVPPIVLNIDTEGHELEVLEGSVKSLKIIDIVIMEVSVAKRFENSYTFEEIIHFMKRHGFYVFSFLNIVHPENEQRTRFVEVVFKRG